MTKEKVSRDCKEKRVMGCDALFRLMKIKTFTRRNIFRVFYLDENGVLVSTNALRLKFGTIRLEDRETESEIVYFHFDAVAGHHIFYTAVRAGWKKMMVTANGKLSTKKFYRASRFVILKSF